MPIVPFCPHIQRLCRIRYIRHGFKICNAHTHMKNPPQYPFPVSRIQQSECACCYRGDMRFANFAQCWSENREAHMFPGGETMYTGAFKSCFIGVLGLATDALPQVMQDVHAYKPELATQDVVTCIELGVYFGGSLFNLKNGDSVRIVRDDLRKTLVGETGKVLSSFDGGCLVCMDTVEQKDIRQITKGSCLRVVCMQSPLYMQEAIALEDGRLDGWCFVSINMKPYTIPTMWLILICAKNPSSGLWCGRAIVKIQSEHMVLAHKADTPIRFRGESSAATVAKIAKFDPLSIVTPKIFKVFDVTMQQWSDQAQKDAVIECMCQKHKRSPGKFLRNESVVGGNIIHFNWKGSTGTQSIFETGEELFFYVDDSSAAIRAQARIGWAGTEGGVIQWESAAQHEIETVERIRQRDAGLMVVGSRITHIHDYSRTGTIFELKHTVPAKCRVHWHSMAPGVIAEEDIANLERAVLMRVVVMQKSLVSGKVQDYDVARPPKYVLVKFPRNTTIGRELHQAWFNLDQLNYRHLEYKLQNFLSYPWRTGRFSVQERVGMSIKSIHQSQSKVCINTESALRNFHETLVIFCEGAKKMHQQNIAHCDLNTGNITLTQTMDGETFALKMIDFDHMIEFKATDITTSFHADLRYILTGIATLLRLVECVGGDDDVTRNVLSRVIGLIHTVTALSSKLASMSICSSVQTADFFTDMQEKFHFAT